MTTGPIMAATVPRPIQVVIDDVGWWSGEDGHTRNEPYRTGMPRNHVVEDYEVITLLGRRLGIRPLAAMALCEWDRKNILRREPTSMWLGAAWGNARWQGPWLDEAAEILRRNREHIAFAVHAIGHEFWKDGVMERAEWHDAQGRMRPADTVRRHPMCCGKEPARCPEGRGGVSARRNRFTGSLPGCRRKRQNGAAGERRPRAALRNRNCLVRMPGEHRDSPAGSPRLKEANSIRAEMADNPPNPYTAHAARVDRSPPA